MTKVKISYYEFQFIILVKNNLKDNDLDLNFLFNVIASLTAVAVFIFGIVQHRQNIRYRKKEQERELREKELKLRDDLRKYYEEWRDHLRDENIIIDPPRGTILTTKERNKIREYWPNLTLLEYEKLKEYSIKKDDPIYFNWLKNVGDGITSHRTILQEFCYYEKHEDLNSSNKEELVEIVHQIYEDRTGKKIDSKTI